MRALSLRPDFALDILTGKKTTEYRSWNTNHRGDLLICSTARKMKGTIPGHALIVCEIAEVVEMSPKHYAWKLKNFRTIKPFEVKGQQGFFNVDDDKIEIVEEYVSSLSENDALKWVDEYITPIMI
jgi:ASCH domain.